MASLADSLPAAYAAEAGVYRELLAITREQGAILESGDGFDRCVSLFARKGELLRSIMDVEAEIEPLKHRWWSEAVDTESHARFNGLLDSILATIDSTIEQERRNEELLLGLAALQQEDIEALKRRCGALEAPEAQ